MESKKILYQITIPQIKLPFVFERRDLWDNKINTTIKFGYARVSTRNQSLDLQLDALKKSDCEEIFKGKVLYGKDRPQLEKLLSLLRSRGHTSGMELDRLGRSLKELLGLVNDFQEKNISFISLNDSIALLKISY